MPSSRALTPTGVLLAFAALTGCAEEDTRLFDETGVWTLEKYTLDGSPFKDIDQNRKNRFLLRFKPADGPGEEDEEQGVVAAAACHETGSDVDVDASTCVNAGLATWSCQCFTYTYEGSTMVWQEFEPNTSPPLIGAPTSGETGGDGDGGGAHTLTVAGFEGAAATYQFVSLPEGLFNSDGEISKHVFQLKAEKVWTEVDIDGDETPDLDACSMSCFPSEGNTGAGG